MYQAWPKQYYSEQWKAGEEEPDREKMGRSCQRLNRETILADTGTQQSRI